MSTIRVDGKEYELPAEMTGRELRWIKQETGLRAGDLDDETNAGDPDALLALVVVAMRRAGEEVEIEDLLDLRIGAKDGIDFVAEDDEERPTRGGAEDESDEAPAAATGRRRSARPSASAPGKSKT